MDSRRARKLAKKINGDREAAGLNWATLLKKSLMVLEVAALLSGCSIGASVSQKFEIPLNPTVQPLPTIAQVPLTIGVYYESKFRSARYEFRGFTGLAIFLVGQASVTLFDQVFPALFKDVSVVPTRPPLPAGVAKVDAVIEPAIENFEVETRVRGPGFTETYLAEITYRFTLWSFQGERIASWTITGNGDSRGVAWRADELRGQVAELAMRDAAVNFLSGFRDAPEVRRWLRDLGVEGATRIQE